MKTGIQISSVKAYLQNEADLRSSLQKFHDIGYRYAQMQWMNPEIAPKTVAQAMQDAGLVSLGIQDYYDVVLENEAYFVQLCTLTNAKYMCLSGIPARYCSYDGVLRMSEEINRLCAKWGELGLVPTFHPRWQEYALYGEKSGVELLLDNTDKRFQMTLDFNHVIRAGVDPAALLQKTQGRCDIVHFKDMKTPAKEGSPLTPVGQGCINWQPIFDACVQTGVQYGLAEQESWETDAFKCLAQCYAYITAGLQKANA